MHTIMKHDTPAPGYDEIDAEHQKLLAVIEQFIAALSAGKDREIWIALLGELLVLSRDHFSQEEALLDRCAPIEAAAHKGEHDKFIDRIEALEAGVIEASIESVTLLLDWLVAHIQDDDRLLLGVLAAASLQAAA